MTVAALYVDPRGCYASAPGVELWDEARDARGYDGPHPVVAHPPCTRWCRLAGLVEARWGHRRGDDGGTFAAALASVRRWGGCWSIPPGPMRGRLTTSRRRSCRGDGRGRCAAGGCHVEQGRYGHAAKKATWLYAYGAELPSLRWGHVADARSTALVSWCGNRVRSGESRPRVGKRQASATPPEFRDMLLAMARSARQEVPHAADW
jgi:hypothetical protein